MSDTGLNAGIYEQLRRYADRFDCALVKLRSEDKSTAAKACGELSVLLRELGSGDESPGPRLIGIILRKELSGKLGEINKAIETLAKMLNSCTLRSEDIVKLEFIASTIDKECLTAGARMRGRA